MRILIRSLAGVVLGCLLVTTNAWGVDYFWRYAGQGNYPSAKAACTAGCESVYGSNNPNQDCAFSNITGFSGDGNTAYCRHAYRNTVASGATDTTTAWWGINDSVNRFGSGCTAPKYYDAVIGGCVGAALQPGEKCADQTGGTASNPMIWDDTVNACVRFTESEGDAPCTYLKSVGDANPNYTGTGYIVAGTITAGGGAVAPPTFAQDGLDCVIATVSTSKCIVKVTGLASCEVVGKFTGEGGGVGTDINDALCPEGGCDAGEAETTTDTQDCEPVSNGAGGTTCTQTKITEAEGEQSCGTFNGAYTCGTKAPASNGVVTNITATTETEPDGDIKVTTVKDSTLTLCDDINSCTTKHSTTTSSTTTKPSGVSSTSSSCVGACTSTGGGVETIPGAGSEAGTGSGTCIGEDCGDGGDGTADIASTCEAVPPCDGDPFLCAILKQDHLDTCKLMAAPTAGEQAEMTAELTADRAELAAHQATLDSSVSGFFATFQSATSGGGGGTGACLPDLPFSVLGHSVTMPFSQACGAISFVRLMIIAIAYLMAARIVFREV